MLQQKDSFKKNIENSFSNPGEFTNFVRKRKNEVHMCIVRSSEKRYTTGILSSSLFFVFLKLIKNCIEFRKYFFMKKLRVVNIFPTAYYLLTFDKRFKSNCDKTVRWIYKSKNRIVIFKTAPKP